MSIVRGESHERNWCAYFPKVGEWDITTGLCHGFPWKIR